MVGVCGVWGVYGEVMGRGSGRVEVLLVRGLGVRL
jgi:hypothetical protein